MFRSELAYTGNSSSYHSYIFHLSTCWSACSAILCVCVRACMIGNACFLLSLLSSVQSESCLAVKDPAQAIPLQLVWDRAARVFIVLCKIIILVIQGWLVSHVKACGSSVLCMRWQDSQAQAVSPRRGLSISSTFKCQSCHLIQEKGVAPRRKIRERGRLHRMVTQRKAALINKCMHVHVNTWRNNSVINALYIALKLIWNISVFLFKIQITCILSSPRAFIVALFWREHLFYHRSHKSRKEKTRQLCGIISHTIMCQITEGSAVWGSAQRQSDAPTALYSRFYCCLNHWTHPLHSGLSLICAFLNIQVQYTLL